MRVLAFSDLHHSRARAEALVAASEEADLVIGAGDFANHRQHVPEAMNLMAGIAMPFVVVPGNNESDVELRDAAHAGTTMLHGQEVVQGGIRIVGIGAGVPVTPWDWSFDLTDDDAEKMLSPFKSADILITHSPPKGVADKNSAGMSLGSQAIFDAIERLQPSLVLCGHIHESWGQEGRIGPSRICNLGPTPNWFEI